MVICGKLPRETRVLSRIVRPMASTICGWCGDRTHMKMMMDPFSLPRGLWKRTFHRNNPATVTTVWMSVFQCSNEKCMRLSVGSAALDVRSGGVKDAMAEAELQWEPAKISRPDFVDVPPEIASTASEAHACLSIGAARGAIALARAVVEATAKAKGITVPGIVAKINGLRDDGTISALPAEASHQIRKDGNSIAHGDIGDEPVSVDDAQAILDFMDVLLDEVFQRPAKLNRLKQRHDERKQGNGVGATPPPAPGGGPA